jgi:glutamine---fructose-6-phosphate transaminase (isomerizing)
MTLDADIRSTPSIVRETIRTVGDGATMRRLFQEPVVFLGSGSSHCIGLAGARLCEEHIGVPAQALLPSEYRPRTRWLHVALSRTGQTTELLSAMQSARDAGASVFLIVGDTDSPAERLANWTLALPFAAEDGVVQTRFITACLVALRLIIEHPDLSSLPDGIAGGLEFDPAQFDGRRLVFLGREWRYGLARSAALTLQESALQIPESHQTLDYRHGPIACADRSTLVWCFDHPDDSAAASVLRDVSQTGATIRQTSDDPLVALVQAQLLAAHRAAAGGIDPEAPRHLTRAVVLPGHAGGTV